MYKFWLVSAVSAIVVYNAVTAEHMFHDTNATIEQYPYVVSMLDRESAKSPWDYVCAGAIVSPTFIVTSGSCAENTSSQLSIHAGSNRWNKLGSFHSVKRLIPHERYAVDENDLAVNDIALVEVSPPFELDQTRQIIETFGEKEPVWAGSRAVAVGWGRAVVDGDLQQETLHSVGRPMASKRDCDKVYREKYGTEPRGVVCFEVRKMTVCKSDKGEPLIIDGRLAGVTSYSNKCQTDIDLGLFTKVSDYHDWIVQYINA